MSYINKELPRRISVGFKGGPEWRTTVSVFANGEENSNADWLYARYRYTANMTAFSDADRQELINIFQVTKGRAGRFLFRDPTDHTATNEPLSPTVGTSNPLQLMRTYAFGDGSAQGLIQAPSANAVICKDGSPVAGTWTDGYGIFTPTSPWASGTYTWSGSFCRWVRFDSDWAAFSAVANSVWSTDMDIVEVRRK